MGDIQQLLVAVTIHSCSSSGSQYFRIIEDLVTLLGVMQTSKMPRTQGRSGNQGAMLLVTPLRPDTIQYTTRVLVPKCLP